MFEEFKKIETLAERVKEYINTRIALLKLSVAEKISKVAAVMIALLMMALVFFLFLVLACVAGAVALGQWLNNYWLGFLITAGIVFIAGLLIWVLKDRLLQRPLMKVLLHALSENDEDEKE